MYRYEVILYWSAEDDAYIAEVPELPGCCADGETRESALRNVEIVIGEWIETAQSMGREIPKPIGRLRFA
jgi:predicted RNase H-like HicB family nuclease